MSGLLQLYTGPYSYRASLHPKLPHSFCIHTPIPSPPLYSIPHPHTPIFRHPLFRESCTSWTGGRPCKFQWWRTGSPGP